MEIPGHTACKPILGRGVEANIEGDTILVGNEHLMITRGIGIDGYRKDTDLLIAQGHSAVFVAKNSELIGLIDIKNKVRPGARRIIKYLRNDGIREVYLITGDHQSVAEKMAAELIENLPMKAANDQVS